MLRIIDALEDNDDVQDVYANFDIPDAVMDRRWRGLERRRRRWASERSGDDGRRELHAAGHGPWRWPAEYSLSEFRRPARSCSCSTRATTRRCAPSSSTTTTTASTSSTSLGAQVLGISAQDLDSHEHFADQARRSPSRCWPTPTRRSPRAYGTLGPDRLPPAQRVHHRRRRHRPLRPPGHRRPDVPPGQRARRRARSALIAAPCTEHRVHGPAIRGPRPCRTGVHRRRPGGGYHANPCSLLGRRLRVLGIDPGLTRCGYAVVDGRRPAPSRPWPSASSAPRRPRSAAAAPGRAARRAGGADRRVPARRRRRRARVLPGQRAHGDDRRPGQRAGPGRGRRRRAARSPSTRPNQVKEAVAG